VHSPDRLARNYAYQVLLIDEWRRRGVELVFLNQPLGQSPEDDLLLQCKALLPNTSAQRSWSEVGAARRKCVGAKELEHDLCIALRVYQIKIEIGLRSTAVSQAVLEGGIIGRVIAFGQR